MIDYNRGADYIDSAGIKCNLSSPVCLQPIGASRYHGH